MKPCRWLATGVVALLAATAIPGATTAAGVSTEAASAEKPLRMLVFSRTTSFRHASIEVAKTAVENFGRASGIEVDVTEDPTKFKTSNLRRYDVVMFLLTTGNILDSRQRGNLKRFVQRGGGYVGVHSAADSEYDWHWYRKLVGARFKNHPLQQPAMFDNEALDHPATRHLPERFPVVDEFYAFKTNPRDRVRVLLTIDESTYLPDPNTSNLPGGSPTTGYMGDHPMAWCHRLKRGTSFYTELGHEPYLYLTRWYQRHLLGGIRTAARDVPANCA